MTSTTVPDGVEVLAPADGAILAPDALALVARLQRELGPTRAALLARQATAHAKGARIGATNKAADSVSSALEAFERMEEKVMRSEVEAEVIADTNPRLLDTSAIDRMDADEALAALKAKVAAA